MNVKHINGGLITDFTNWYINKVIFIFFIEKYDYKNHIRFYVNANRKS